MQNIAELRAAILSAMPDGEWVTVRHLADKIERWAHPTVRNELSAMALNGLIWKRIEVIDPDVKWLGLYCKPADVSHVIIPGRQPLAYTC